MENNSHVLLVNVTALERERIITLFNDIEDRLEFVDTAAQALNLLAGGQCYDAIFWGIESPNDDPGLVLEAVRLKRFPTAVVLITEIDDVAFYLQCLRGGVFDYILRPVDWREFRRIYGLAVHRPVASRVVGAQAA